jgi:hypothetical protein
MCKLRGMHVQGGFSTVIADIVWGIKRGIAPEEPGGGIDNTPNIDGDPAGEPADNILTFDDSFDLSKKEYQQLVEQQLGDLFTDIPNAQVRPGREHLVKFIVYNPLQVIRTFCAPESPSDVEAYEAERPARERFCGMLDPDTNLPLGDNFNHVAYRVIATSANVRFSL